MFVCLLYLSLSPTKEEKTINPKTGGQGNKIDTKRDLLANIIDKINIMYQGKFTEAERVIVETIYDRMQQSATKTLKKQAKNSDANMFAENIFPKEFEKIAQKCYMEQMEAFSKLLEDEQFYKTVRQEMAKAMYVNLQQQNAK